jgi:hypothetical protein
MRWSSLGWLLLSFALCFALVRFGKRKRKKGKRKKEKKGSGLFFWYK